MTLTTLIIQIILTIPLTIIVNYLSKNSRINKILIPTIYIIIMSAIIPSIKQNIFLIVIFEIFIRNFYVTNITNQNNFQSNTMFIIDSILSIGLSLFTYNYFISNVTTVIPNPEDIKSLLWFLIIIFGCHIYKSNTTHKEAINKQKNIVNKKEHTIMQYAKFKNKYANSIKSKNKTINDLVYSLMIYESYKTPNIYRKIEEYIGAITKKETKYGIMRVSSYNHLTDEESIKITIDEFEKRIKNQNQLTSKEIVDKILNNYDNEEKESIKIIYNDIVEFSKK